MNSVTLPVKEGFLFKNQSHSRSPPRIVIPALNSNHPVMCPVLVIEAYLCQTVSTKHTKLFLNPDTGSALNAGTLSFWLCKAINFLLPDAICKAHDVRKLSHSLAWARGIPIEEIVKKGFWTSQNTFIRRYLVKTRASSSSYITAGHKV